MTSVCGCVSAFVSVKQVNISRRLWQHNPDVFDGELGFVQLCLWRQKNVCLNETTSLDVESSFCALTQPEIKHSIVTRLRT